MDLLWFFLGFIAFEGVMWIIVNGALRFYDWYRPRHPIRTLSDSAGGRCSHSYSHNAGDFSGRQSIAPNAQYNPAGESYHDTPASAHYDYETHNYALETSDRASRSSAYHAMGQSYDCAEQSYSAASYTCDSGPSYDYCGGGCGFDNFGF